VGRPALAVLLALVAYLLLSKDVADVTMDESMRKQAALACGTERIGQLFLAGATGDTAFGPLSSPRSADPTGSGPSAINSGACSD
jgi:hypothetical protein